MSLAQETVNKLLDFNQKLDIGLLDTVVGTLYSGTGEQQKMAQEVLTTLKEHPDAWTKVTSSNPAPLPCLLIIGQRGFMLHPL